LSAWLEETEMKVVQLGPYPPPNGGVQTNLVAIRDYLREHGHSCAVINITRHHKPEAGDVYYPKNAIELIWRLFRKRYDIVHLHVGGRIPLRVVALAFSATAVPWAKAILTLHSGGYPSFPEARELHRNSLLAFVLRRFDGVIGVNREMMEFFWNLGISRSRTKLIQPQSVARTRIADALEEPLASFFRQHDRVLVSVCGLEPEYDVERQIAAMAQVLRKFPNAGLAIIGSGSLEARLCKQIQDTSYARHLLLCGDVPHELTLRAIADGDVLLRTTLYDGDAISVREALYLGTPVIATDNGMRPDGVDLIPMGDTEALGRAIERRLNAGKSKRALVPADDENLAEVLKLYCQANRVRSA
jgi:glycosyltransferase involved in cell wall biosynthesis